MAIVVNWGNFAPRDTFGNVWRHFVLLWLKKDYWDLVESDWEHCWLNTSQCRDSPTTKNFLAFNVKVVKKSYHKVMFSFYSKGLKSSEGLRKHHSYCKRWSMNSSLLYLTLKFSLFPQDNLAFKSFWKTERYTEDFKYKQL
jgi:hypothetical protein